MKRELSNHDPKSRKRKKKNKRRELDIMRKNMDPKMFKKYLMQKIKLLKKELEVNANVLRKNPTKIVAKIRQAELKTKLEETVRYIPIKQKPQQQKVVNPVLARRMTSREKTSYKKFVRRIVKAAPSGYMSKESLLEKLLEEFDLTKGWFFSQLGITDFAQFLRKESSVYVDFYGYVNSRIKMTEDDKTTEALKKVIVSAKVLKRFNSVFDEPPNSNTSSLLVQPAKPLSAVDNEVCSKNNATKVQLQSTICKGVSIAQEVRPAVSTSSIEKKVLIKEESDH